MEKKSMTAVKWLESEMLKPNLGMRDILEQAKAMEKEQIVNAHLLGLIQPLEMEATKQAEQYYTETFEK
jgi:hypothetical protein